MFRIVNEIISMIIDQRAIEQRIRACSGIDDPLYIREVEKATRAQGKIEEAIKWSQSVYEFSSVIPDEPPHAETYILNSVLASDVQRLVKPGNTVWIYGAYRESCINAYAMQVIKVGAYPVVSLDGTIPQRQEEIV